MLPEPPEPEPPLPEPLLPEPAEPEPLLPGIDHRVTIGRVLAVGRDEAQPQATPIGIDMGLKWPLRNEGRLTLASDLSGPTREAIRERLVAEG